LNLLVKCLPFFLGGEGLLREFVEDDV